MPARSGAGGTNLDSTLAVNVVPAIVVRQGSSVLVVDSTLALDIDQVWRTNTALLAASSTLAVDIQRYLTATAKLAGASTIALNATVSGAGFTVWQGTALLAATSTLAADAALAFKGIYDETGATGNLSLAPTGYAEFEFGLAIDPNTLKAGDVLTFRVYADGSPLDSYDQEATLTVSAHSIAAAAVLAPSSTLAFNATLPAGVKQGTAVFALAGSIAADTKLYLKALATLPVASSLASNIQRYIPALAALPGTSTLVANAREYNVASATLSGTSTLAVDAKEYNVASATLPASSTLSALVWLRQVVASNAWAGSSSLALNATILGAVTAWPGTTVFAGASALTGNTKFYQAAVTAFAGVSTLSALPWLRQVVSSNVWIGGSSLAVNATVAGQVTVWQGTSVLAGTTTLAAGTKQKYITNPALLPATSSLAATAVLAQVGRAQWQGASTLTAGSSRWLIATAALAGSSGLAVDGKRYLSAASTLAGASNLAALPWLRQVARGTLAGSSTFDVFAVISGAVTAWSGSTVFAGASTFAANVTAQWLAANVVLPATSTLAADSKEYNVASATLVGASSVSVNAIQRGLIQATAEFDGASSIAVNAVQRFLYQGSGLLSATSTLAAGSSQKWAAAAKIDGTGALAAVAIGRLRANAKLSAGSDLLASLRLNAQIRARLDGVSLLATDAFSYGASEVFFTLNATSSMTVNAFRPRRPWRRRTDLQGRVVTGTGLRGEVKNRIDLAA